MSQAVRLRSSERILPLSWRQCKGSQRRRFTQEFCRSCAQNRIRCVSLVRYFFTCWKNNIYIYIYCIYLYKEAYMYMKMIMWVFCLHFLENAIVYRIYIVYCIVNTYLMSVYSYMDYPARPCGMRLRTAKITGHAGSFQDKILVLDMWIRDRQISGLNFEIHPNADLTYLCIVGCLTSNTSAQPAICKSKCNMKLFKGPHQLDVNTI